MNQCSSALLSPVDLLFALVGDELQCLNITGNIESISSYSSEIFLSGQVAFNTIFHEDDQDIAQEIFSHTEQRLPKSLSLRIIQATGKVKILKICYVKQLNTDTNSTQIQFSIETPQPVDLDSISKIAETDLVAMLENTNDYIYFKDRQHIFTGASQTLVNITDNTAHWQDLIGKTDYEVFPKKFADIYFSLEKQLFNGSLQVAHDIQPILDTEGNQGWVDNRKYPIKDSEGNIIGLFGIARDITQIKATEEALKVSKKRLQEAQHIAKLGNWEYNILNNQLVWSDEVYRILDIKPHTSADFSLLYALIHPEDREKATQAYRQALYSQEPYEVTYRLKMADKQIKFVKEQADIFFQSDDTAIRVLATLQDITTAQRPKELNSRLIHDFAHLSGQPLFEAISQFISETLSIDYVFVGRSYESKIIDVVGGWGKDQPLPNFSYQLDDTPCANVQALNQACIYSEGIQKTFPKDALLNEMGIESYIGVPLFDVQHKGIGIFVALHSTKMQNTSELLNLLELASTRISSEILRENALLELQTSQQRFHQIALQNRTFLWEIDVNGLYTYCSREVEAILGFQAEELIGKRYFYDLHPEMGRETFKENYFTALQQQAFNHFEYQIQSKDGRIFWMNSSGFTLDKVSGKPLIYQGSNIDITTHKLRSIKEQDRTKVLELISQNIELPEILKTIVLNAEKENPEILCSILLLDKHKKHLLSGSAPSLPDFYNQAINGVTIGVGVGSCGTAAYTKKRVIVEDIQNHLYWEPYKDLAAQAQLRSCWSQPIFSSQNEVMGTFAMYHHDIHSPTKENIKLIEQTADLASIAIERYQVGLALKASEKRWQFALEGAGSAVWEFNLQTHENFVSQKMFTMLGIPIPPSPSSFLPLLDWEKRLHPDSIAITLSTLQKVINGESTEYEVEQQVCCDNGKYIWLFCRGIVIQRTHNDKPLLLIGTAEDITQRKQAESKLELAASVFSHAREGIIITDEHAVIIEVNQMFSNITGHSREEAIGRHTRLLQSGRQSIEFYQDMWDSLLNNGYWCNELWNSRKNGEIYPEMLTISAVYDTHNKIKNYVALFTDITEVKAQQKQLEHIAHYDVLTHLPNRVLFADRLHHAMQQTERRHLSLAVLFLDLDGFKAINDTYGHDSGDTLLKVLAERMSETLREGDTLCRFGGDEFIAVLVDLEHKKDCEPILKRLLQMAAMPVISNQQSMQVSASIGVSFYPEDNSDAEQLIRHADQAMYVAKESGKNRYHISET